MGTSAASKSEKMLVVPQRTQWNFGVSSLHANMVPQQQHLQAFWVIWASALMLDAEGLRDGFGSDWIFKRSRIFHDDELLPIDARLRDAIMEGQIG